ncbi:MAG: hypothetical protein AAF988_07685 [Pseudomonadota bacterium]
MKTLSITALTCLAVLSLSACGTIPACDNELDNCNRGGAFSEERTVLATPKVIAEPAPTPVEAVAPAPAPAPAEEKIMMQSAEPQFNQIAK